MKSRLGQRTAADKSASAHAIPVLSVVALRHPLECEGGVLAAGSKGTVVHAYRGGDGYEVEFAEPFHCVVTVGRDDIEPV